MKVVIINKSDSTGGAAVVSYRLMEALRQEGVDARMLVCEKCTDSPFVEKAASDSVIKRKFVLERMKIFLANGFKRSTLFKIDTGEIGLPLWRHPLVKSADAILLNWVNQGMLSLKGVKKILKTGKPVIWTMHDMWCMTGICHHAGTCNHYRQQCGNCPLLSKKDSNDLSHKIFEKKQKIYDNPALMQRAAFVAVSTWLKGKASQSTLLGRMRVEVIPNAFKLNSPEERGFHNQKKIRILFGAARLDDPIKGLDTLKETTRILKAIYPEISGKLEISLFGNLKDDKALEGFELPVIRLGVLKGEEVAKAYREGDIVVSASSYETLPGTLVEAQAYGCIPVSFNQGGQADIIDNLYTGVIVPYSEVLDTRARNLAQGILWAVSIIQDPSKHRPMIHKMAESVDRKFSYSSVAGKYISLIMSLSKPE
ncbi:MAG: glycosyltransferase [Muribaculaceae bacterium]|nr:glycosyltransferase [Muribaculaceae bacterium]